MQRRKGSLGSHHLLVGGAALAFASLLPTSAHATEGQWKVAADASFTLLRYRSRIEPGFGPTMQLSYGLTDAFNLLAEAGGSFGHGDGDRVTLFGFAGAAYVLDVLEWVPYAGFGVGARDVWTTSCPEDAEEGAFPCGHDVHPSVVVPVGLDYQFSRSFSVGGTFRYNYLFFGQDPRDGEAFVTGLRAQLTFY